MAATEYQQTPFSAGQNEGTEISVLPFPQLSSLSNARFRKFNRIEKRFGTATLTTLNSSGGAVGNGTQNVRTIGPGCLVVDDQCAVYDQALGAWRDPRKLVALNTVASGVALSPRVPGAISGWLPDTAFYPAPPLSQQNQTQTPCAQTYGLGYLWTCIQMLDPQNATTDSMLRVVATNPTDQTLVFLADFRTGTASFGGLRFPKLLTCGSTIVLTYQDKIAAGVEHVNGRILTTLAGGFGAAVLIENTIGVIAYDAYAITATEIATATVVTGTPLNARLQLLNASLANTASKTYVDALNINAVSLVGAAGTPIYLTVGAGAGPFAERVAVYNSTLTTLVGTATLDTTIGIGGYSALLPGGGVRAVYGFDASGVFKFQWQDVTTVGGLVSSAACQQFRIQPISRPFTIGTQVYVWTMTDDTLDSNTRFGFATLMRLPALTEYPGSFAAVTSFELCAALEMSPHDFLINANNSLSGSLPFSLGLPSVTQIGSSATYAFVAPTLPSVPNTAVAFAHDFRVIQAKHYTDDGARRSVNVAAADGANFIAGGCLTRTDQRGAVEEGFAVLPYWQSISAAAGGALTTNVTYQYTAIYRVVNANGRTELSAPFAPASQAMGANTKVNISFRTLDLGARASVMIDIYRTLGNGQTFYYLDTIDGTPPPGGGGSRAYADVLADTTINVNKVLYIQVGQALANGFPPPCRFAISGGQRLWLGGLLRNDVIQCSKLIFGDQSPTFAASSDQFSIVLPAACTGLAWMDNLVAFTAEGIYVISGDGPDDSGQGSFSPPTRLPFALGCIEPRSVVTVDDGTFFQTARGLYLLPRGFGAPVPAGDTVMQTLGQRPIITGCAVLTKQAGAQSGNIAPEQTVQWSCVDASNPSNGNQIVYDLVHKAWSVDSIADVVSGATGAAHVTMSAWFGGELALAEKTTLAGIPYKATGSTYDDSGQGIQMTLVTGDIRPFDLMSHGVVERLCVLTDFNAACSLVVGRITDQGSFNTSHAIAGPSGNGTLVYTECALGHAELRDVTAVRLSFSEASALNALAFIGLAIEMTAAGGLKLLGAQDRIT